jgi:hypothetical protein
LQQIRERLAEKRVVQHIPADMSGLKVEENTRGVERVENGRVYLRQVKRDEKTRKLIVNPTDEAIGKTIGTQPVNGSGKLQSVNGVRVISDNFGVAILDHAIKEEDRFAIIPHHKVWHRIQELKARNAGKYPRLLRIGTLFKISKNSARSDYRGVWMLRGAQLRQRDGLTVDFSVPDAIEYRVGGREGCYQAVRLQSLYAGQIEILTPSLAGVSSCPITSSA